MIPVIVAYPPDPYFVHKEPKVVSLGMRLSQESLYGIAVMVALARHESACPAGTEEIASARSLPRSFVAKILQKLVRGGLRERRTC